MGTGPGASREPALEVRQWEALQLQSPEWQQNVAPTFTLDEDEQPLLAAPPTGGGAADSRQLLRAASKFQVAADVEEDGWRIYGHETWRIAQLAGPIVVSQFMNFALNMVSVAFIGRLSQEKMAVAVLASSFMSVTGFSVVMGLLGALDTLGGQAWGAKNYRALGLVLQKAIVTTLATTLAVCALWANVEPLMRAMGQEDAVARGAARYLLLAMPALLCTGMFECLKRYLMAQGVVTPVTAVSCLTLALAPLFNWLFIFRLGGGLDGAVAALVACNASMLGLLAAYVAWHERRRRGTPQQTWHGWSRDCLKGLGSYYKLALPSTLMVCLEWWAYELCIFMSGWLPHPTRQVSAMGVMMQVSGLAYMLPMGLSCATSVRVSNALGAGLPHSARRSAHTATAITACTQAALLTAILLGRDAIGRVFTNVPEVIAACAATFPLMSASMFGDGLNAVISGVLRGAGRQELGALLNLTSYWGLGLPTAYLLAVKAGLQLRGLWGGLILATSVQGSIMLVVLARFNWAREAERAASLVAADGGEAAACGGGVACEDSAVKLYPGSEVRHGGGGGPAAGQADVERQ